MVGRRVVGRQEERAGSIDVYEMVVNGDNPGDSRCHVKNLATVMLAGRDPASLDDPLADIHVDKGVGP